MRGNVDHWRRGYEGDSIDRELETGRKTHWASFKENFIAGLGRGLGWGVAILIVLLIRAELMD